MSFRELGVRIITAAQRQTLVQRPSQTIGPTTINFGIYLTEGTPSRVFSKKNPIFSTKNCVFSAYQPFGLPG